jgi:hypothetical protein
VRALAAAAILVAGCLAGCHAPPAPPPSSPARDLRPPPKLTLGEAATACGLEPAERTLRDCDDFDPEELATFTQVNDAFARAAPPPIDPLEIPYRPRPRFHRWAGFVDQEVVALARSYLCRTDLVPEIRFPRAARAVAAYEAARIHLATGRREDAIVWFHEAAQGPADLPETPIAAVVQLELLAELASTKSERIVCYDVLDAWVHEAHAHLCEVERPYASKACLILGRISLDADRLSAWRQ